MPADDAIERARYEPLRRPAEPVSDALETMPYGLYIVGSRSGAGDLNGMMADWVMQVAFRPRLLLVSFENDATTLRNVRETGVFTVNVLPMDAGPIAQAFAQPRQAAKVKGRSDELSAVVHDKLRGVDYSLAERTECPVLDAALAWLECEADQFVEAGDHTLAIARVLDGAVLRDGDVLTQKALGWSYAG